MDEMKTCILRLIVLSSLLSGTDTTNETIILQPSVTVTLINDPAFFNCSTTSQKVEWLFGSEQYPQSFIYSYGKVNQIYKDRFQVESYTYNNRKWLNLKLRSTAKGDAGRYICRDPDNLNDEGRKVHLTVLETEPACDSNLNSGGLIIGCETKPETVQLSCSVRYNGEKIPELQWIKTGENIVINSSLLECSDSGSIYTCNLTMESELQMEGDSYVCQTTQSMTRQYNCTSGVFRIIYVLGEHMELTKTVNDKVNCSVNSNSQASCTLSWIFDNGTTTWTESRDTVIEFKRPGRFICQTICVFGNSNCTFTTMTVNVTVRAEPQDDDKPIVDIGLVAVIVVGAVVVTAIYVIAYILWIRRKKKRKQARNASNRQCTREREGLLRAEIARGDMDLRDRKEEHKKLITDRLDPDFGLLDELLASRSLTRPEVAKVKAVSDSYGRSEILLEYFFDRDIHEKFLNALRKTQQTHLANYIFSNGERSPEFGDDWPLTEREISILDTNQRSLVDLLEACDLLLHLYSHKVVNHRQRDFVSSKTACYDKNEALLEILRRTSLQNHKRMIYCLHLSKQSHIAKIFEEGGEVVRVRSELETESDVNDVEDELITKITEMLGDHSLDDSARILERSQLRLIAAKQGHSVILYFICKTSAELVNLQEMQTSGKLANVVRELFNEMLSRPQVIQLRTTLYEKDFSKYVGAKSELEESCGEDDESDVSNTTMHDLPLELLDMILEKVYGHSSVIRSQLFQPTDEEIIRSMASVDFCWFQRVIRRRFKNVIWRNLTEFYRKYYKRRIICRNTRLYLMENIQMKGISKQLRSLDCLTDIQTRLANRGKDKSENRKNEDLLHLAKSLDDSRYSAFVRCLRESKQTLCAEVVTNGGVVLKAEIQCSHLKNRELAEQQLVKTLNDLRDKTRSRPAPLEQQLNRLKAENIEILHSLLDRNPVVWFWCHTKSGLAKLQTDSDLILELLNFETIARPSEIFNAETVNIDSDRFRKEVGEIYLRDRIEEHMELITDRLDPDFGLLDELITSRSLTRREVAEVKAVSDSYGRSERLLEYVFYRSFYEKFLDALRRTQQSHLANFIFSNGKRRPEFGDYWPLTEREIYILDDNQRTLVDLLDTTDLLPRLYSHEVVNNQQRDFVSSRTVSHEKNEALLEILRRTSLQNYKETIDCLRLLNQGRIAYIFEGDIVLRKITPMAAENRDKKVKGLTILSDELFVGYQESSIIEAFSIDFRTPYRKLVVNKLIDPGTIAACVKNSCLYVMEQITYSRKKIFRIKPDGTVINIWETDDNDRGRISVNRDGYVVMTAYDKGKVKIYTPDGTLLRDKTIDLSGKNITYIFHAINLADGNFIICHGMYKSKLHQVCKIDAKGKVLRSFGNEKGSGDAQLSCPAYVAERSDGSILVADQDNHRIILLNSELELVDILFTKENCGVSRPRVMSVYKETETPLLFLGCNKTSNSGGYVLVLRLSQ